MGLRLGRGLATPWQAHFPPSGQHAGPALACARVRGLTWTYEMRVAPRAGRTQLATRSPVLQVGGGTTGTADFRLREPVMAAAWHVVRARARVVSDARQPQQEAAAVGTGATAMDAAGSTLLAPEGVPDRPCRSTPSRKSGCTARALGAIVGAFGTLRAFQVQGCVSNARGIAQSLGAGRQQCNSHSQLHFAADRLLGGLALGGHAHEVRQLGGVGCSWRDAVGVGGEWWLEEQLPELAGGVECVPCGCG